MRLFIIRHGKAREDSPSGSDADRELRKRGHRQAQWLAERISDDDQPPTSVLASPRVRAQQTAHPIAEALNLTIETEPLLDFGTSLSDLVDLITEHADRGSIALVGHNPTLSSLASVLVDGVGGHRGISLRTGEAVVIDFVHDVELAGGSLVSTLRLEE